MAPIYGWSLIASRLKPLQGGSLLFTTKFPEIPGTHFIPGTYFKAFLCTYKIDFSPYVAKWVV